MKRRRLYVRPARAPKWWPRVDGKPAWVAVLKGGGWVVGEAPLLTPNAFSYARLAIRETFRDGRMLAKFRVLEKEKRVAP